MAFDWREYLALAGFLGQSNDVPNQEAALRSAVSRAYYAAFCHARNHARDRDQFIPGNVGDDHRRVRDHFRSRGMGNVVRGLNQLRQWRNACDYADTVYNLPFVLSQATTQARDVFDELGDISEGTQDSAEE